METYSTIFSTSKENTQDRNVSQKVKVHQNNGQEHMLGAFSNPPWRLTTQYQLIPSPPSLFLYIPWDEPPTILSSPQLSFALHCRTRLKPKMKNMTKTKLETQLNDQHNQDDHGTIQLEHTKAHHMIDRTEWNKTTRNHTQHNKEYVE